MLNIWKRFFSAFKMMCFDKLCSESDFFSKKELPVLLLSSSVDLAIQISETFLSFPMHLSPSISSRWKRSHLYGAQVTFRPRHGSLALHSPSGCQKEQVTQHTKGRSVGWTKHSTWFSRFTSGKVLWFPELNIPILLKLYQGGIRWSGAGSAQWSGVYNWVASADVDYSRNSTSPVIWRGGWSDRTRSQSSYFVPAAWNAMRTWS